MSVKGNLQSQFGKLRCRNRDTVYVQSNSFGSGSEPML